MVSGLLRFRNSITKKLIQIDCQNSKIDIIFYSPQLKGLIKLLIKKYLVRVNKRMFTVCELVITVLSPYK